jgi:hypothetical protein
VKDSGFNIPGEFKLHPVSPNPFNSQTQISYRLQQYGEVSLKIFNLLNQEVAELVSEHQSVGEYRIIWFANELPSGIYIVRLAFNNTEAIEKVELLK